MLRQVISAGTIAAIQIATISAPFVHTHDDDHDTDHHAAHAVHAHVAGHIALGHTVRHDVRDEDHDGDHDGAHLEVPDHDRAVYLPLFVAVAAATADVPDVAIGETFELKTPVAAYAHRSTELLPGHDPPLADAVSPRAPPA